MVADLSQLAVGLMTLFGQPSSRVCLAAAKCVMAILEVLMLGHSWLESVSLTRKGLQ